MPSTKILIGVVFGGASEEHEISILSAKTVINSLRSGHNIRKYKVNPYYIDKEGRWWSTEVAEEILKEEKPSAKNTITNSLLPKGLTRLPEGSENIQIWFPVLHGPNGEDGTVQGLFKLMQKPFVGSGVLGSAIGMDKLAMKAAFAAVGLHQTPYLKVNKEDLENNSMRQKIIDKIESKIGYPSFTKPANLGSSVGISKVKNNAELIEGLNKAALLDKRILVEKGVIARELECAVLGRDVLKCSVIGEIRFNAEWYDYETKYNAGLSKTIIPADLPIEISNQIQLQAIQACKAIEAFGIARVDFFYNDDSQEIWINEINTLPGFTSQSMYPMLWEASGVTLEQLVSKLVESAGE